MKTNQTHKQSIKVLMVVDNAGHTTEVFIRNEINFLSRRIETLHVLSGPIKNIEDESVQKHVLPHLVESSHVPLGVISILRALPCLAVRILRNLSLVRFVILNISTPRETLIDLFKYASILNKLNSDYDIVHVQFAHMLYDVQKLRQAGVIRARRLACSFRGHDISKGHLVDKLKQHIKNEDSIDLYLPVSELFREELISMGARPETVITKYSPIDVDAVNSTAPNESPYPNKEAINILTCGRLIETKGFDLLINAIAALDKRHAIQAWIIGDGPRKVQISNQIERLCLTSRVTLLGAMSHEDVLKHISSASVFVLCSRTAEDGDREGIPNVLKEAMVLRTLTVASDHSGIPELIQNNKTGFLFTENSVQNLTDCLEHALSISEKEKHKITTNAEAFVKLKFGLEKCGNDQISAYKKVLRS